jgi:hypothetical protein
MKGGRTPEWCVIDEAKNLAASDKMRGFFASLRMTSVVGWF